MTLASAQFLMTLDSSVTNVSMATVAKDAGTTGLGVGALASQLGSVIVSAVPDEQSSEVGMVQSNPAVPEDLAAKAQAELAGGIPFMSGKDLQAAPEKTKVPPQTADAIIKENATARIDGLRTSLPVLAVIALIAMFFGRRIPTQQPSAAPAREPATLRRGA